MKYKIPEKNREYILVPEKKEEILELCKVNKKKREEFKRFFDFEIEEDFIIASGHQTIFYHPGIWVKNIFLNYLSKKGFKTKFFEHDIDDTDRIFFYYPDKNFKVKREFIYYSPLKIALEYIESKDIIKNEEIIRKVFKNLYEGGIKERAYVFFEIFLRNLKNNTFYSEAFSLSRREYEGEFFYDSILLSELLTSKNFTQFFTFFFINAEEVFESYNKAIIDYRGKYDIKDKKEPAPLLERYGDLIELPFFLNLRERYRVYKRGENLVCEKFEIRLGKEKEEVFYNSLTLPLRPRALVLSIYQKIFLCDLFYHGVSGKNYDEAASLFIERFLGLSLPESGVISLTLYMNNIEKRDFPFFFFDVNLIKEVLNID